jgi:GT2 family glycosyltransferase
VSPDRPSGPFAVVICTRNRGEHLLRALDALERQADGGFQTLIVDQSDEPNPELERRAAARSDLEVLRDEGRGLSRARNLGWRRASTEWVAFVDDDCLPDPDWAGQLTTVLEGHPEVDFVGCQVADDQPSSADHVRISVFEPQADRLVRGSWVRPWYIGLGACMAIRREALSRLGGFDERLGPGVADFPGADDMDFNYRLLRSGATAYVAPEARVIHEQWRPRQMLASHLRGYSRAWAGFSMKQLRTGNLLAGLWLWLLGVESIVRFLGGGIRRRSWLRIRLVGSMLLGHFAGTLKGAARKW